MVKSQQFQGQEVLLEYGLQPDDFWDKDCGGATNAIHTLGFGTGLRSNVLPAPEPGLTLGLCHFIDGGMELVFPWTILQTSVLMRTSSFPAGCSPASARGHWSTARVTDFLLTN